jgi:hypothetical protein
MDAACIIHTHGLGAIAEDPDALLALAYLSAFLFPLPESRHPGRSGMLRLNKQDVMHEYWWNEAM